MTSVPEVRDRSVVDVSITVIMLAIFVAGFAVSSSWQFEARLVPQVICGLGAVSALATLAQAGDLWRWRRAHPDVPHTHPVVAEIEVADPADMEPEAVFARAKPGEWIRVAGWWAGFFVLLFVAGVYVTAAVFSFAYLRAEGSLAWWKAALYGVIAVLLIYVVFNRLLITPLPEGLSF